MPGTKDRTAILIDANSLLHRAWHALPPLTAPDGRLMNAAYGFTSVLLKILQSEHPDYLVVCWDTAVPTFRHKAAPEYKAQRETQPQEFYDQVPSVKAVVEAFGGLNVELDGYEADDLLGTLAQRLAKNGVRVSIMTSDRDVWQIIGPRIKVVAFKKGVSETITYDEDNLKEITGLDPTQVADYKALRGDASDNLKGVPGIGEKTATDLLNNYRNLEGVFKAAHNMQSKLTDSVRRKLIEGEAAAEATLPLVKIVTTAPVQIEDSEMLRKPADEAKIKSMFVELGFKSLLGRIGAKRVENEQGGRREKKAAFVAKQPMELPELIVTGFKLAIPTEVTKLLEQAQKERTLFVRSLEMSQESLFADIPELVLGSHTSVVVVSRDVLENQVVKQGLSRIFEDADVAKVGHDLKAFRHWCRGKGFGVANLAFDTEIAAYLLAAGEGDLDLPTLAMTKLGVASFELGANPGFEIELIRGLEKKLSAELEEAHLQEVMSKIEMPLIPVLAEMEDAGILIDRKYFKALAEEFTAEKQRLEREMVVMAGEEFNPASPNQLSHILFDVLGISSKGLKRGKTGISTAAAELEKLDGVHPIIAKVGDFREVTKLLSTYVEALPLLADESGRVHTTFNQTVTATGRLSSTNPNLQNIPIRTELGRRIRQGFEAQEGYELLSCDYSQIELRIVAALADDKRMLEAFRQGQDIHTATAAAIWHVAPEAVTKEQRRAAKAVNFGIIYGQGPMGLARSAGIPFQEAKHFIEEYFLVYSGIRDYLEATKEIARSKGYVETMFGRRRPMIDINSNRQDIRAAAERMAINMPVQGTAADIIKLAMIEVWKKLPNISVQTKLLLQVHDELLLEVPEVEVVKVAHEIVGIMENAVSIACPIVVEAKRGKSWDGMVKV